MANDARATFISELLNKWINARGDPAYTGMQDLLWVELKKAFEDMMENINDDAEDEKPMCAKRIANGKSTSWGNTEKKLCKILIRLYSWMDGLERKPNWGERGKLRWKKKEKKGVQGVKEREEEKLQFYFRCLVGKVTMLRMLAPHCKFDEVAETVKKGMETMRKEKGISGGNELCKDLDVENFIWGGRFIWNEAQQWVNQYSRLGDQTKGISKVDPGNSTLHKIKVVGDACRKTEQKKEIKKETLNKLEIEVTNGKDLNLGENDVTFNKEALEDLVKEVKHVVDTERAGRKDVQREDRIDEKLKGRVQEAVNKFMEDALPKQQGK
ncbi:hypothetical protein PCOAH_00001210 [Plasmodium coatneyi]|uniref:Schizont-infected cell agglutination extracellular alpha domain-containing protein n=1 Tax=Plasmodium coatneyi TaxID=208452 RepID=A0A1B1DSX8_9APIC|nr:hypothetical protein PCOAH_00001210 [Plasmodium coatneyi]ANQ05695.1 hypothetical protein PCOAH_00001210 [Plasmodium coatneyi]